MINRKKNLVLVVFTCYRNVFLDLLDVYLVDNAEVRMSKVTHFYVNMHHKDRNKTLFKLGTFFLNNPSRVFNYLRNLRICPLKYSFGLVEMV